VKKNVSIIVAATAPIGWLLIGLAVIVLFAGWAAIGKLLLFMVVVSSASLAHAIWLAFFVPELAAQRSSIHANTKTWERPLLLIYMSNKLILGPMAIGLDLGQIHLSQPSVVLQIAAIPPYLLALVLIFWSMKCNPYFELTARIQAERNQQVVTNGPYRFIRHPGYLGMAIQSLTTPIMARSMLALAVSISSVAVIVIRTSLEDRMLKNELAGYLEYAKRTKSRLVPWIW